MNKILLLIAFTFLTFNISCKKDPASSKNTAPIASFTITPDIGTTNDTFTFDASGSTDNEDDTSILEVRWDWENDGTWDTEYSTTKIITHQYLAFGTYTVKLEVKDSGELTNTTTKTVSLSNTPPTASFTFDPPSGTTATVFNFDASGSSDNEDNTSLLEVRWDWEDDGTWDTNYSTTKTASHRYPVIKCGDYSVKLEVKDSEGKTKSITVKVVVNVQYEGTLTDVDGNVYNTIQIGNQIWMAENLRVTHYRNGEAIQNITDFTQWEFLTTGAYCTYDNVEYYAATYGRLYNWYAVDEAKGLAPDGWHVPSDEEWKELEMYLGMSQTHADNNGYERGLHEGAMLKSCSGWTPNSGNGTNDIGFNALPAGYQTMTGSWNMNRWAEFWTSTAADDTWCWRRELIYAESTVVRTRGIRYTGISVRCIKD